MIAWAHMSVLAATVAGVKRSIVWAVCGWWRPWPSIGTETIQGVDLLAGRTETMVICDDSADVALVGVDSLPRKN